MKRHFSSAEDKTRQDRMQQKHGDIYHFASGYADATCIAFFPATEKKYSGKTKREIREHDAERGERKPLFRQTREGRHAGAGQPRETRGTCGHPLGLGTAAASSNYRLFIVGRGQTTSGDRNCQPRGT